MNKFAGQKLVPERFHLSPATYLMACTRILNRISHQKVDCGAIIKQEVLIGAVIVRTIISCRKPVNELLHMLLVRCDLEHYAKLHHSKPLTCDDASGELSFA